jgi:hypothetical protein
MLEVIFCVFHLVYIYVLHLVYYMYLLPFHSCAVHFDLSNFFITPTNAQLICFETLKFNLKYITNAPTCFGFE